MIYFLNVCLAGVQSRIIPGIFNYYFRFTGIDTFQNNH